MREWLQFDPRSPWGMDAFEANVPKGYSIPAGLGGRQPTP